MKLGKRTTKEGVAVYPFPHIITSSTYTFNCSKQLKLVLKQKIHKETLVDFPVSESTVRKCYKEIIRWFLLQWNSCKIQQKSHWQMRKHNTALHKFDQVFKTCDNIVKTLHYGPWGRHEVQFQEAREEKTKSGHSKLTRGQWSSRLGYNWWDE